jgi:hypothetical protein
MAEKPGSLARFNREKNAIVHPDTNLPFGLYTDDAGHVFVTVDGAPQAVFNSHIVALSVASQSIPSNVPTKIEFSSVVLDTHGLYDLFNDVLVNPYYGLIDCYVRAVVSADFSSESGSSRVLSVAAGFDVSIALDLKSAIFGGNRHCGFATPAFLLSSSIQYLGFKVEHDLAASDAIAAAAEIEFFL